MDEPSLLVLVGPTATGKSALAAQLGQRLGGEVISADSVQVYRHFDIGSGKPTDEERALCPHHLIDIIEPDEQMEAHVWAELAEEKIAEVRGRGAVPIVCGGTFLWVRALLFGLAEAPPGNEAIRAKHKERAEKEGREALHRELAQVDPRGAERLHPNDLVRVSRALEVFELTGRPLSDIQAEHGFREPKHKALLLGVKWEREDYEARLRARVEAMVAAGFRDEVRDLLNRGYSSARAMDAVGYKQVKQAVLDDAVPVSDEELSAEIVRVTRIFARRQRTWLRDEPVRYVDHSTLADSQALDALSEELCSQLA